MTIGDRVIAIRPVGKKEVCNVYGTIRDVRRFDFAVEFDGDIGGHSLLGRVPMRHGWYCSSEDIEVVLRREDTERLIGRVIGWV